MYILYTRVSRKVHRLTKILSWNVTKQALVFNIVPLVVNTLLPVLQCLDPINPKSHQQQIRCHHKDFSVSEFFSPSSSVYTLLPLVLQCSDPTGLKIQRHMNCHHMNFTWTFQPLYIGLVGRVFANGPGDLGSIPGHIIPNTLKMVLYISLLNTQQYKLCIKG